MGVVRRLHRRIRRAVGFRDVQFMPDEPASLPSADGYSPELRFGSALAIATETVRDWVRVNGRRGSFLDVGGAHGGWQSFAGPLDFHVLDIEPGDGERYIQADICSCPQVASESFDVVFSLNTFEHLKEPWLAAGEIARLLKPGGVAIIVTHFAWRYHPYPIDFYRFSHAALEDLFSKHGLEAVTSGYDLIHRREDRRGGRLANNLDVPPIDELGGWRENWTVYYVGRKPSTR